MMVSKEMMYQMKEYAKSKELTISKSSDKRNPLYVVKYSDGTIYATAKDDLSLAYALESYRDPCDSYR